MNWLRAILKFLGEEKNQKTLTWVGGAIVAVSAALYGGYQAIKAPPTVKPAEQATTQGKCSPVVGNITDSKVSLDCSEKGTKP